ncbi:MAG: YjjI family glycine radical enzyme [Clostridiales bacterium]|nr:YjjI family glycine radical enzyme [Clostridiales bacterium]
MSLQQEIYESTMRIATDTSLTHEQAMMNLSKIPGQFVYGFTPPEGYDRLLASGVLSDLGEGYAPICPRYLLPDYELFLEKGCRFLRIDPPKDLFEAIEALKMFYRHVPSITNFPVYLGRLDRLLQPFIRDEEQARYLIRHFLTFLDRTISDSYAHANIGPEATLAGEILLDCDYELQNATPSITLLYDPEITPDAFAARCARNDLACAKPSFANDRVYRQAYRVPYGVASCYNVLPVGGGAFTLARLNLKAAADQAKDIEDLLERVLPEAVRLNCAFMDAKIAFLIEKSLFFKANFLVQEGFLRLDRFTGMFGVVGLAECVNRLEALSGRADLRYGHSGEADALAHRVMRRLTELVNAYQSPYCAVSGGRFSLHAQVGLDTDIGVSSGARIPIGDEIALYEHLRHAGQFHPYFHSGVGDIFPFEVTAKKNPESLVDIVKGAFSVGMRYFSAYADDSDVIRITGYLVKKSDIEKLARGEAVQQDNVIWGLGEVRNSHILERKVRSL